MAAAVEVRVGAPRSPVLDAFMACRERNSFIMGPLGSGKTVGAVQRLLMHMIEQAPNAQGIRPTRFIAVRNTFTDLETTTIKDFRALFDDTMGTMRTTSPPTYKACFNLSDGTQVRSEVVFLALDRDDDVRKLRGSQVTGFWLNETKELVRAVVNMADLRHGRYPSMADGGIRPTWHGMLGDTNAPDTEHWYYELAEQKKPKGWRFFRQPGGVLPLRDEQGDPVPGQWVLNPQAENVENLPDGYYERGMEGKEDDWISVMLSNEYGFAVDGKAVHPEYIDSVHCAKEVIPFRRDLPLIVGVDFGRTPAASFSQRDPVLDRRFVIDELVTEDMSAALFGPMLKRYIESEFRPERGVRVWCDPAGGYKGEAVESSAIEVLRAAGIPAQPCDTNKPLLRRAAVANVIARSVMTDGRSAFVLSPKCVVTRKGLAGGFCYRRMKLANSERYTEEPDKNHYSHVVEALEYGFLGDGEGRQTLKLPNRGRRRVEYAL